MFFIFKLINIGYIFSWDGEALMLSSPEIKHLFPCCTKESNLTFAQAVDLFNYII